MSTIVISVTCVDLSNGRLPVMELQVDSMCATSLMYNSS
jgi:hypothetical protein